VPLVPYTDYTTTENRGEEDSSLHTEKWIEIASRGLPVKDECDGG
jgi:hypothetical protein